MDSAVVLAEARAAGFRPFALTVRYGQRHACELEAAQRVAQALGAVEHRVVDVDLRAIGGSSLTADLEVPHGRLLEAGAAGSLEVPSTYVPARNTIFLSIALGWAEVLGATDIYIGVNAIDYSGYPDCRPVFLASFERLASVATAAGTEQDAHYCVHAPLLELSKRQIVERARELGVDLGLTHTCYDPVRIGEQVLACGTCDACALRLAGFRAAGCEDPLPYVSSDEERP
jgi:7-cyano-7-deazaguanine synthase